MQRELIENIKKINNEISDACSSIQKSKDDITLIAVSKRKSYQLIELALENGVINFGENYAQELKEKSSLIDSNKIIWHFIGPIQSNKIKILVKYADWIHTIDREKVAKKLDYECKKLDKVINACIQINISNEASKSGCHPEELLDLAKLVKSMENVNLKGIMALPKLTNNKNERYIMMQSVKELSLKLQSVYPEASYISLGTTSDFKDAIINGANMVRIGESIFGKRL